MKIVALPNGLWELWTDEGELLCSGGLRECEQTADFVDYMSDKIVTKGKNNNVPYDPKSR